MSVLKASGEKKKTKKNSSSSIATLYRFLIVFSDEYIRFRSKRYHPTTTITAMQPSGELFFYHINENLFFFGTWLTVIFFRHVLATFLRGLNKFTCRPTLMRLVSAPCGNTACTCGTTVDETMPPSGPMACTSCLTRETMAK